MPDTGSVWGAAALFCGGYFGFWRYDSVCFDIWADDGKDYEALPGGGGKRKRGLRKGHLLMDSDNPFPYNRILRPDEVGWEADRT